MSSPWYTESTTPPIDYVPVTPTPRKYVLRGLSRAGVHVVQILHSKVKSFNDPLIDAYDRYRPKLQDRATDIIMEKSDALLFMSKRTSVKQVDKGFGKKEAKAEGMSGSERVIYTDERAGFLAKNRLNMPPSIPFKKGKGFAELSKYFYTAHAPVEEEVAA